MRVLHNSRSLDQNIYLLPLAYPRELSLSEDIRPLANLLPRHLLSAKQLNATTLRGLIDLATALEHAGAQKTHKLASGKVLSTLFFQPSTRTRLNFESSMFKLGGRCTGFSNPGDTRAEYESLEDMVAFTSAISDVIVLRHPEVHASRRAAETSFVPVINAGDGYEHPTQGLGDIATMLRLYGADLSSAVIGLVGDTEVRCFRSLIFLLAKLGVGKLVLMQPCGKKLASDIEATLREEAVCYEFADHLEDVLDSCDIVETIGMRYFGLRTSPGVAANAPSTHDDYQLTKKKLQSVKNPPYILHPGPRSDSITTDVDSQPQAKWLQQARHGLFMRMALLACYLNR